MIDANTLKKFLQASAKKAGIEIYRATPPGQTRWSHTVTDYYPITPRPRWVENKLPHSKFKTILDQNRPAYREFLAQLESNRDFLRKIGHHRSDPDDIRPTWNNDWFTALDAAALVNFLLWKKPKQYFEIGSGNSTLFARDAVSRGGLPTIITSMDPRPRRDIDKICDRVIRKPLEECDISIFDSLTSGDILFFDGSHRVFTNSDVTVFFFEILPRLRPGILVHIHDIFLPEDYPSAWNDRLYSEQYLLGAMLLSGNKLFDVVAPNYFICKDPELGAQVRRIFGSSDGGPDIPFLYDTATAAPGASFWLVTKG